MDIDEDCQRRTLLDALHAAQIGHDELAYLGARPWVGSSSRGFRGVSAEFCLPFRSTLGAQIPLPPVWRVSRESLSEFYF